METIQVDKHLLHQLIRKIELVTDHVKNLEGELKGKKKHLDAKEVMELTGVSYAWLKINKHSIGCSKVGGKLKFSRKDVEEYIEQNYFKITKSRKP